MPNKASRSEYKRAARERLSSPEPLNIHRHEADVIVELPVGRELLHLGNEAVAKFPCWEFGAIVHRSG